MKIELLSKLNGRGYRLNPDQISAWYEEHILGALRHRAAILRSRTGVLRPGLADGLSLFGSYLIRLFRDGELVDARAGGNLIVDVGRALVIDRVQGVGGPPAVADYLAIGTGTTGPAAGNTTLEAEVGTRIQGTLSQPTAYTDRDVGTFPAGNGTGAITEAGRLNASTSGTLLCRATFSVINKAAGDSLQVQYDITD